MDSLSSSLSRDNIFTIKKRKSAINKMHYLLFIVSQSQGLPSKFCGDHLPKTLLDMVLEDENGTEYGAIYIGKRTGLSGGWRGFALDHKLDDGDALVFELIEPTRFKVS